MLKQIASVLIACVACHAQDVCVKCQTGQPFLCDGGQLACGLMHPGCSVANNTSGCARQPYKPDISLDGKVLIYIEWSIGHQGARVWNGDLLKTGSTLLEAVQRPMGGGVERNRVANSYSRFGTLTHQVAKAVAECQMHHQPGDVVQHMWWVCNKSEHHEDTSRDMLRRADTNEVDFIRSAFSLAEHDDKVKNVLYCYNDTDVKAIARQQCH